MADERMDGNALVTTKIARVEREAIIPARTWNGVLEIYRGSFFLNIFFHHLLVRFILPEDLFIFFFASIFHHLVVRWKKLSKKNPLKWTRASS